MGVAAYTLAIAWSDVGLDTEGSAWSPGSRRSGGDLRRLSVSLKRGHAMESHYLSRNQKLVYVRSRQEFKYSVGRSRVAYSKHQEWDDRVANSVAYRAPDVFALRGVQQFEVRVRTCTPRQRVKTGQARTCVATRVPELYGEYHGSQSRQEDKRRRVPIFAARD